MQTRTEAVRQSSWQGMPLATWVEWFSAIEAAGTIASADAFRGWMRGCVGRLVPHAGFVCVLGAVHEHSLREHLSISDGCATGYIRAWRTADGEVVMPAFRTWLAEVTPQTDQCLDAGAYERVRKEGVHSLWAHGFLDRVHRLSSYFELLNPRAPVEHPVAYALHLLTPYIHAAMVSVAEHAPPEPGRVGVEGRLTPREREVLRWISEGKSVWETAQILGRSEHTIKNQVRRVYSKLGVHTRVQAARAAEWLLPPAAPVERLRPTPGTQ